MLNKSVIILCLCCIFGALFSFSVYATPTGDKAQETVTNSHSGEKSDAPTDNNTSSDSEDAKHKAAFEEAKEQVNGFLKENVSTGLIVNRPAIIEDVPNGDLLLKGKKWVAKNIKNVEKKEITLNAKPDQNVYIYGCENTTFIIPDSTGHIAHIELQKCKNVIVRFPKVITSLELWQCQNITINCKAMKAIQLDQINTCNIYLPASEADSIMITQTQTENLTMYRVLIANGKSAAQPLTIPDSKMLRRGSSQCGKKENKNKIHEQYVTRMEQDPGHIWKVYEGMGSMVRTPKGELAVIKKPCNKYPELFSIQRCFLDERIVLFEEFKPEKRTEYILEEPCQWMWVKRFKKGQNNILVSDTEGDLIQITRDANQLKDDQGYLILPENNKFPTLEELQKLQKELLRQRIQKAQKTTELTDSDETSPH